MCVWVFRPTEVNVKSSESLIILLFASKGELNTPRTPTMSSPAAGNVHVILPPAQSWLGVTVYLTPELYALIHQDHLVHGTLPKRRPLWMWSDGETNIIHNSISDRVMKCGCAMPGSDLFPSLGPNLGVVRLVYYLVLLTKDGELRLFTFPLPDHVSCHAHVYPWIRLLSIWDCQLSSSNLQHGTEGSNKEKKKRRAQFSMKPAQYKLLSSCSR